MSGHHTPGWTAPRRRALEQHVRPTRAELDLDALERNYRAIRALAPGLEVLAMVKANAYGHGAPAVAHRLEAAGVRLLGVALVEEGMELRHAGVRAPILVLGGAYQGGGSDGYQVMVELGLGATVFRPEHVEALSRAARAKGRPAAAHLKVDTGMGRLGASMEELPGLLDAFRRCPEVRMEGLASHFASADVNGAPQTRAQLQRWGQARRQVEDAGFSPELVHVSNSAALLGLEEARRGDLFNLARPGLTLYGLAPAAWLEPAVELSPVLSWKTAVIHLKTVPAGASVSYGATWTASRPSRIATLPVGYADGYSRAFSSRASVLVRGRRAPVVGRVCMDMCMVDVTDVPGVQMGDEVVLIGRQGDGAIRAQELAELAGTIPYEVLCGIGARVPRTPAPR
ncbi:MAG TPA: alanine racemase [Myxococcales bacterium]|nr:alanine racemase [Myxococcales bacterium]